MDRKVAYHPPSSSSVVNKKRRVESSNGDAAGGTSSWTSENQDDQNKQQGATVGKVSFPDVLKHVTESNFLSTEELGRLLLLTSKSMVTSSAFDGDDESVWKSLSFNEWGVENATNLIESLGLPSKECFLKLTAEYVEKDFEGLRALQYSPKDYLVIVTVRDFNRKKSIVCKSIKGDDIPGFFERGEVRIQLDEPVWEHLYFDKEDVDLEWEAKVNIMRLPDRRLSRAADLMKAESNEEWGGSLTKIRENDWTLHSTYGHALMGHYFEDWNGLELDIDLDYHTTQNAEKHDTISVSGIWLRVNLALCGSDHFDRVELAETIEGKDITFAHLLEALDVWEA